MLKAGLIIGAGAFILTLIAGLIQFEPCGPCFALFLGLAAGYLGAMFEAKTNSNDSARIGANAGALGGVAAIVGQMLGDAVGFGLFGQQQALALVRQLNGTTAGAPTLVEQWAANLGGAFCFGLVDLGLMAGLGAVGGILWYQIRGKPKTTA